MARIEVPAREQDQQLRVCVGETTARAGNALARGEAECGDAESRITGNSAAPAGGDQTPELDDKHEPALSVGGHLLRRVNAEEPVPKVRDYDADLLSRYAAHLEHLGDFPATRETAHVADDRIRRLASPSARECIGDEAVLWAGMGSLRESRAFIGASPGQLATCLITPRPS